MRISVLTEATRARCDPSSRAFGTDHRTGVALLRLLSSMLSSRRTRRAQMHAGRTKITTRSIYYLSIAHVTECPGPDSNRDALRRCPLKTVCLPVPPPGRAQQDKLESPPAVGNYAQRVSPNQAPRRVPAARRADVH